MWCIGIGRWAVVLKILCIKQISSNYKQTNSGHQLIMEMEK